jgi:magnesium chelatase subunit I
VVRRRDAFERDPRLHRRVAGRGRTRAQAHRRRAQAPQRGAVDDARLERAAQLCIALGTDGLRGELTLMRAARALAALDGDQAVTDTHLQRAAKPALRHRLRRDPLDDTDAGARVERAMQQVFAV